MFKIFAADCCPNCSSTHIAKSRWRWRDSVLYVAALCLGGGRPYRCLDCYRRFWRGRSAA
jgi:DNA-directed RNA polymerase subunit RPC12/RpoP